MWSGSLLMVDACLIFFNCYLYIMDFFPSKSYLILLLAAIFNVNIYVFFYGFFSFFSGVG